MYSSFLKDEYLFWINYFKKWIIFLNIYSGFSLPASKMVAEKCYKLISNNLAGPFKSISGVLDPYRGLTILSPFIEIFNLNFEWIVLLNILYSIEWIFVWMNILDFVLNLMARFTPSERLYPLNRWNWVPF